MARGIWVDGVSLKEVGGPRTFGLGVFDYSTPLQGGKSYTRTEQIQLPTNVQGVFQLVLATNAGFIPIFENGATGNNSLTEPDL